LGCHSKSSRPRLSRRLPAAAAAAAPALAGLAAAVCLSPQALASPSVTQAAGAGVVNTVSAPHPGTAWLFSATRQAMGRTNAPDHPATYKVRPGDSLSAIAGRVYHDPDAWPVLYFANRGQIKWADVITAGQVLKIPAKPARIPAAPGLLGPSAPAATGSAPQAQTAAVVDPGGSFAECVIARESGGDAQVMNASGHYGLYQFSASTWAEYGGNPADFGNASAAEQNQVFANALAAGGESNWSAYDGC
jgi:LysM repeat protein